MKLRCHAGHPKCCNKRFEDTRSRIGQHPWLRPEWKGLPAMISYCSSTKCARRFGWEDNNGQPTYYRLCEVAMLKQQQRPTPCHRSSIRLNNRIEAKFREDLELECSVWLITRMRATGCAIKAEVKWRMQVHTLRIRILARTHTHTHTHSVAQTRTRAIR